MARLVGKETTGNVRDPDGGWLALPTALAPKLWLWVLHTSVRAATSDTTPVMLSVAAIVLGLAALILWRSGRRADDQPRWRRRRGRRTCGWSVRRGLGTTGAGDHPRRGTKPYETAPDLGHRPTELAQSGVMPASGTGGAWTGARARRRRGRGGVPGAGARRHRVQHVRSLPVARASGRGRHGRALHRRAARRRGLPAAVRRQAAAPAHRAQPRRGGAVHRRGEAGLAAWCTRTSCPCSTSAR